MGLWRSDPHLLPLQVLTFFAHFYLFVVLTKPIIRSDPLEIGINAESMSTPALSGVTLHSDSTNFSKFRSFLISIFFLFFFYCGGSVLVSVVIMHVLNSANPVFLWMFKLWTLMSLLCVTVSLLVVMLVNTEEVRAVVLLLVFICYLL